MAKTYIGECTECGTEDVKVTLIDEDTSLCEDCLENSDYAYCDECQEYWDNDCVEFVELKDGRYICQYCRDALLSRGTITDEDIC